MELTNFQELQAKRKFKENIKKYSDNDIFFKVESEIGCFKGVGKTNLTVLREYIVNNLSFYEISVSLNIPIEKVEKYYKNGIRELKKIIFENEKISLVETTNFEFQKAEVALKTAIKSWTEYLKEMNNKSPLDIYNLMDREDMIKEKLFDEKNLKILEALILENKTLKEVGEIYSISCERVRQIKNYCLRKIKEYKYGSQY